MMSSSVRGFRTLHPIVSASLHAFGQFFSELENGLRSPRAEEAFTPGAGVLDVDHILPEKWYAHWPLDGQTVTGEEASNALLSAFSIEKPSPRIEAINWREKMKAIGSMSEEATWMPVRPFVRWLSAQRIAQIWLHHANEWLAEAALRDLKLVAISLDDRCAVFADCHSSGRWGV
jgi:hypothetical protein